MAHRVMKSRTQLKRLVCIHTHTHTHTHTRIYVFVLFSFCIFFPKWTNGDLFFESNYEPVNQDAIRTCECTAKYAC